MLVQSFGEKIKMRRKELRITQPHLAALADISTNTLYKSDGWRKKINGKGLPENRSRSH
jgi:DNA-binding transcriptional regulator YiaG